MACQNNILNINLMYSRSLAHLFSKTVWLSLKCQLSRRIEISLHLFPSEVYFLRKRVNLSSESSQLYSGERVNQIRMGKQVLKNKA